MKYDKLKRQSFIEAIVVVVVVLVLGAIVYLISAIDDDYDSSNKSLQKQVDAIDLEMNTLRGRFTNIQKNIDLYNEVKRKQEDGRLVINRQGVQEKFNQYKAQYGLNGMRMSVTQVQDVKDVIFKHKNSNVNFADVTVGFDVTIDQGIFQLVNSLRDELPGVCKLIRFNVTQQRPLNEETLLEIKQKGETALVKAEIRFVWFGINSIDPEKAASAPATATSPATPAAQVPHAAKP